MVLQVHAVVRVHGNLPGDPLDLPDHPPVLDSLLVHIIGRVELELVLDGLFLLHRLHPAEFWLQAAFGFGRILVIRRGVVLIHGGFRPRRERKRGPVVGPGSLRALQFRW